MPTEREKMLNGEYYDSGDKELVELRQKAHRLSQLYNETFETQETKRKEIMDITAVMEQVVEVALRLDALLLLGLLGLS